MAEDDTGKPGKPAPPPKTKGAGWLSKIAPGVRKLVEKRHVDVTPENLWIKDPDGADMLYRADLEAAQWVTPSGRHMRIGAGLRFRYTFDDGAWEEIPAPPAPEDPLTFADDKPYVVRLAAARKASGAQDAVSIGYGTIQKTPTVVMVQDFGFMGGSLGMAAGEGFIAAADAAVARQVPMVAFTAAGGARMQEGALSLMQLARTTIAIQRLKDAHLPYIVVLTDHRRRHRLLRHAGGRPPGRAGRSDRVRRAAGDRTDHSRNPAAGVPTLRVPARQGDGRPGRRPQRPARDPGQDPLHPDGRTPPRPGRRSVSQDL
jgi:acetyl-CoA carboxylase carboxyl transferase subunit beta